MLCSMAPFAAYLFQDVHICGVDSSHVVSAFVNQGSVVLSVIDTLYSVLLLQVSMHIIR